MIASIVEGLAGLALAYVALRDLFDTVITPGQSHAPLHVSRRLVFAALPLWKRMRGRPIGLNFAPLVLVGSFVIWMLLLVLAFGLMLHACGDWFSPHVESLGQALYLAGGAMVTMGMGTTEPHGPASVVSVAAGFCGLAAMTLAVTYLLEVQSNIAHRDIGVFKITTSSGEPPSALALLERYAALGCRDELGGVVHGGRDWCATVLQSHASHPSLIYFRSAGTGTGWPAALGALADLALIFEQMLVDPPARGAAILLRDQAARLAHDVGTLIGLQKASAATVDDVETLRARLAKAGYRVREDCDLARFLAARNEHVAWINALAEHLGTPDAPLVPHRPHPGPLREGEGD
jgi:hypothetical protein